MSLRENVPWFLWPFAAVWDLLAFILRLTGRLLGIVLALVLMATGVAATMTVIGAIVGIPLFSLGLLLIVRSLF
jgi:hypothetical protein